METKEEKEEKDKFFFYKCIKESENEHPLHFTCFKDIYNGMATNLDKPDTFYIKLNNNMNRNKIFDKYIIENEIKKNIIVNLVRD